jgi:hypothetical protein
VHPTELYEAMIGVVIVILGIALARRLRDREGRMFLVAAATYALARLVVVEPLRGDAGRGIYAGISSGQIFSVLVLVAIAARLLIAKRRAALVSAIAAGALAICVADVGDASADPFGPPPPPTSSPPPTSPSSPTDLPPPPVIDDTPRTAPVDPNAPVANPDDVPDKTPDELDEALEQPFVPVLRPHFRVAAAMGLSSALDRSTGAIPTLGGFGVAVGYTPGWFGVWIDLDRFANKEAGQTSVVASVAYARRITPKFTLGARAGIGFTNISFDSPTFASVLARTVRLDMTAEYAVAPRWGVWIRPITIDSISSDALGGGITSYQFNAGVDFRFDFHRTRPAHPSAAPPPQAPLPPLAPPTTADPAGSNP